MPLIDTHAHLYLSEFQSDRHEMVRNAINSGVEKMLLPNIDSLSIEGMLALCKDFPGVCFPMMGLHPCSVKENFPDEMAIVKENLFGGDFIAVGEIGIDLYWDKSFLSQQIKAFEMQIEFGLEKNLPIVIHARESFSEIFTVLNQYKNSGLKGVFHSFTGGLAEVEEIKKFDFYFGINGIVTFKNSGLAKIVQEIPLNRIVLETDSPYLSPVPKRGVRNESAHVRFVNDFLAALLAVSPDQMAEITSQNATTLFNLK